ncbi:MAG TPA: 16S rRNA (cytidine(1402)-2'-O)-methyltransferase [Firmicutes bacterium]|nr:16S rRNA (cytidine(1402)-2'-O)-methyltransferase [Bacillota bacterium]
MGPSTPGTLYICGTPIGNLDDVTIRLVHTLKSVDAVLAEDTRHTRKLLSHLNISKPLISCHEHNITARVPEVIEMLRCGKNLALVSDAGMPGISDPGADLVRRVRQSGLRVVAVPGPSALTTALAVSGFRADRFSFMGFLPRKGRGREMLLEEIARMPEVIVLFEAPHRLLRTLEDLEDRLGAGREVVVARELTKLHEEVLSGTLGELRRLFMEREGSQDIRGEIVIVIGARPDRGGEVTEGGGKPPAGEREPGGQVGEAQGTDSPLKAAMKLVKDGMSIREAVKRVASERGVSRRELYREVVRAYKGTITEAARGRTPE